MGRFLGSSDLEVLRLGIPIAKRDARGADAMFLEIRGLVPFTLLRRVYRREVVIAGWQAADSEIAGLVGSCRGDVTRLRLPERRVSRECEDGIFRDRRTLIASERAIDLAGLVGQRQLHPFE